MEVVSSEEELDAILEESEAEGKGVVIDWMAQWCRKCIYLKPKIEKLAEDFTDIRWCVVDVNAVPSSLVKRAHVTKMPTIQLWRHKKWQAEVIGGHKAWQVLDEIRAMLGNPLYN